MSRKKKPSIKNVRLTPSRLISELRKLFERESHKLMTPRQVISKLKIKNDKTTVTKYLDKLVKEATLIQNNGKYGLNRSSNKHFQDKKDGAVLEGIVDMTKSGAAFIIIEGRDDDVYVHGKNMNHALDRDTVLIRITRTSSKGKPEGEVIKVVKRDNDHFIGTLKLSKQYGFLIPDKLNMPVDVFIPLDQLNGAKNEDKVIIKVTAWPSQKMKSPTGKIVTVLGKSNSSDVEMKSILINNGFQLDFPKEVIAESEAMSTVLPQEQIDKRLDYRGVTTFTIDPLTAKDFDDALSITRDDKDNLVIGVHIADVAHYVQPDSALDKEALERSTSVYLVDRVLPMLPEKLSNELCSLRPHEDKFTFSAIFTFNEKYKVIDRWFGRTVIHSDRRFTYEEAQLVIETGEGDFSDEINLMNKVAEKLRDRRFKNGALDFDSDEVRFVLDEDGKPISVQKRERKASNMLVEDFMLLANKHVAHFVAHRDTTTPVPMVYRIHDTPDPDRVREFANFAGQLGYKIKVDTPDQISSSYNSMTKLAKKDPALKMLEPLAIRSMAKAIYSPNNIGHYGLGFEYYTHFTSPIRRYSDVLVHRILFDNLKKTKRYSDTILDEQCKHISAQEKRATSAERESIKYKQVEFITDKVGKTFEGRVTGMIDKGFFVELLENYCEGMVMFSSLDDVYTLDDSKFVATGFNTKHKIRIGDTVRVIVIKADLRTRKIDMSLVTT